MNKIRIIGTASAFALSIVAVFATKVHSSQFVGTAHKAFKGTLIAPCLNAIKTCFTSGTGALCTSAGVTLTRATIGGVCTQNLSLRTHS
jgi:hypothetical protein